jgi:hypothetical protein
MQTILSFLDADSISLDCEWKDKLIKLDDNSLVYQSLNSFLKSCGKKSIIFFNIIDGFRVIKKCSKCRVEFIFRPRGILPEESYYKNHKIINKLFLNLVEYYVISKVNQFIFLNTPQLNHYEKKYCSLPTKANVQKNILPNIKLIMGEANMPPRNGHSIVYSGGFSKWQNVELVFEIVRSVIFDMHINCEFTILTFKDNFARAKKMAKEYSLSDYIKLKYVAPQDLDNELRKHDIGIIIRDNDVVNATSSPFKIIDYIANGLAVIITSNISWQVKQIYDESSYFILNYDNNVLSYSKDNLKKFITHCFENDIRSPRANKYINYISKIKRIKL